MLRSFVITVLGGLESFLRRGHRGDHRRPDRDVQHPGGPGELPACHQLHPAGRRPPGPARGSRGVAPEATAPAMSAAPASRATSRTAYAVAALALIGFLAVPLVGVSNNAIRLLLTTFLWVTTSLAWNLLGGVTARSPSGSRSFTGWGPTTRGPVHQRGSHSVRRHRGGGCRGGVRLPPDRLPTFRLRGPTSPSPPSA